MYHKEAKEQAEANEGHIRVAWPGRGLRSLIAEMVPSGDYNDFVCTPHGFCVKFLRQGIYRRCILSPGQGGRPGHRQAAHGRDGHHAQGEDRERGPRQGRIPFRGAVHERHHPAGQGRLS